MSHIALARKWRPQRFEDVIGQRGTVETLKNAIATGRLAQSFIFAGPRGVGKTTTARILARALNCVKGPTPEPCGECDACREIAVGRDVDVLEIDGATYTGVDAVREVIVEPLAMAPMRDRFKIFIIDEVHRLSKSAFDARVPFAVEFARAAAALRQVDDGDDRPGVGAGDYPVAVAGLRVEDAAVRGHSRSVEGHRCAGRRHDRRHGALARRAVG